MSSAIINLRIISPEEEDMKRIAALLAASLAIGCYRVCAGLQLGKGRLRKDSESVAGCTLQAAV